MTCVLCARPTPTDRAYCHWCREAKDSAVSSYSDFTRPIREDAATIERRFARAKAAVRRELTTTDAWAQRTTPVVGSRLEDYAPGAHELPSYAEASKRSKEQQRADNARWKANRKAESKAWNSGATK